MRDSLATSQPEIISESISRSAVCRVIASYYSSHFLIFSFFPPLIRKSQRESLVYDRPDDPLRFMLEQVHTLEFPRQLSYFYIRKEFAVMDAHQPSDLAHNLLLNCAKKFSITSQNLHNTTPGQHLLFSQISSVSSESCLKVEVYLYKDRW